MEAPFWCGASCCSTRPPKIISSRGSFWAGSNRISYVQKKKILSCRSAPSEQKQKPKNRRQNVVTLVSPIFFFFFAAFRRRTLLTTVTKYSPARVASESHPLFHLNASYMSGQSGTVYHVRTGIVVFCDRSHLSHAYELYFEVYILGTFLYAQYCVLMRRSSRRSAGRFEVPDFSCEVAARKPRSEPPGGIPGLLPVSHHCLRIILCACVPLGDEAPYYKDCELVS